MVHAWRTPFGVAACALALSATTVDAGPAGIQVASRPSSKATTLPAARSEAVVSPSPRPSQQISPWKDPVGYVGAAISEIPTPWSWGKNNQTARASADQPAVYNDAIALDKPTGPPSPQLLISLAQMAERQDNVPQARAHYQHALTMWPGEVDVLRAAARMEDRQGHLPLAENLYQQAVAANPQHAGAQNDLGLCLARQGKLDASVQVIEGAIRLQPDKALYRNNVATVLVELRQDQRALAHLAAIHSPAEAHYNMGQLLVARGRTADAVPYFHTALQYAPSMAAAHEALAALQGGAAATSVRSEDVAPAAPQYAAPHTQPQDQPTLQFPATARTPDAGASSYLPPRYQAPSSPDRAAGVPQVGAAPRYLPPVAAPTPGMQR